MPIDILEFFHLTPLPGSEDHLKLHKAGVAMDPDMNKYDLNHVTTEHPRMSHRELEEIYRLAWDRYYTDEHIETILRRAATTRMNVSSTHVPDHACSRAASASKESTRLRAGLCGSNSAETVVTACGWSQSGGFIQSMHAKRYPS